MRRSPCETAMKGGFGASCAQRLHEAFGGGNAVLIFALALSFTSTWLINTAVYPLTSPFAPQAQYVAPLSGAVVAFAFAFVCQYRPELFTSRGTVAVTVVMVTVMTLLLYASAFWANAPLAVAATSLRWVACILRDIVLGFALMGLSGPTCAGVLICGYALRYVLGLVLTVAPLEVKMVAFVLCFPVGLIMLWPFARVSFERLHAAGTPADLSVTNPLSFLPLSNRMFVAVVMFHAALGFSVTFGGLGTLLSPVIALVFFAVLLVCALGRKTHSIDALYELSFLLTLAGLLLVPALCMGDASLTEVSSALCEISSSLFALVMWLLIARIGARSPAGALPVLCMVRSARGLGIALGLASGMFATGMGLLDELRIALLAAGIAFVFAAFNFRMAHSFSFDATVRSVRPLNGVRVLAEAPGAVARTDEGAGDGGAAREAHGMGASRRSTMGNRIAVGKTCEPNTAGGNISCGSSASRGAAGGSMGCGNSVCRSAAGGNIGCESAADRDTMAVHRPGSRDHVALGIPAGRGAAAANAMGSRFATSSSGTANNGAAQQPPITDIVSRLDASCAQLAREYRLTSRETDVLRLLARGRNAAYIQQELALTHSTVKSYVADVYRKLNVHSHQELIDLVEHE